MKERLIKQAAARYLTAEATGVPIEPISSTYPTLTEEDAYQIQQLIVRAKVERGDAVIGWKVGATSLAIQHMLGLDEPIYGVLLQSHRVISGRKLLLSSLIHPRVECEIAFFLDQRISGPGVTPSDVLEATEKVVASLEINDPRTAEWKVGRFEVIADNGVAAHIVLGAKRVDPRGLDLPNIEVALVKNDEHFAKATGAAVLGNPANALSWLANKLSAHGHALEAGEVVLSGALTPVCPIQTGDRVEAIFAHLGTVSIEFE